MEIVFYLSNVYTASIIKMTPSCHRAGNHLFYDLERHLEKKKKSTTNIQFILVTHFLSKVPKNINIYTRYRCNTSSLQDSKSLEMYKT